MESMQKSHDGFEMTWAVNVLAPFLLTSLLLGNVKERIINISSISAGSRIDWGNLQQVRSRLQLQTHNMINEGAAGSHTCARALTAGSQNISVDLQQACRGEHQARVLQRGL